MRTTLSLLAACLLSTAWAQQYEYTTPVPILKQINRHNEDGSYSYGYEAADGTFKIETKYPTGEVFGKYGYVDDGGKIREVEYGASRRGFEPAGSDINVPPPTISNNAKDNTLNGQEDDGQYREDPSVYYKNPQYNRPSAYRQPAYNPPQPTFQPQPAYNPPQPAYNPPQPAYNPPRPAYNPPQPAYNPQPAYQPQPQYNPQPQYQSNYAAQPQYNQQQYRPVNPQAYLNPAQFDTHPAVKNIDYFSGSYSIDYTGKK